MYAYATADDVQNGFRDLDAAEKSTAEALLEEAALIIDRLAPGAKAELKALVSCRMVRRVLDSANTSTVVFPMGASQGSMSAMGYAQSWAFSGSNGAGSGELYISSLEKRMLGIGSRLGSNNPYECGDEWDDTGNYC